MARRQSPGDILVREGLLEIPRAGRDLCRAMPGPGTGSQWGTAPRGIWRTVHTSSV